MGKRNGSLIGKRNVGAGATNNASGIWGLNDTQRVMSPDNSSALKSKIQIQYLLVGGGGGGAGSDTTAVRGGGGGAGGMVEGTLICDDATQLYLQVGNGGPGGTNFAPGTTGTPTRISSPIGESQAFGGGGGKGYGGITDNNRWGASGGGLSNYEGNDYNAHPGFVNQGNPGGYLDPFSFPTDDRSASGGGGAGGRGEDAGSSSAGDGGIGKISYITGAGVYYAGGGGGGAREGHTQGGGGAGGGGNGGVAPASATPGVQSGFGAQTNSGGGGGGAATGTGSQHPGPASGGGGAAGVIILRFPQSVTFTETGAGPITYSGPSPVPGTVDERYYTFTQGANYITFTST